MRHTIPKSIIIETKSKRSAVIHSVSFLVIISFILSLRYLFHLIPDTIFLGKVYHLKSFFEIISVTAISVIPIVFGIAYILIFQDDGETPEDKKFIFLFRLVASSLISFLVAFISIAVVDPVHSEGWVRTIFISLVLSLQAPLVILIIIKFSGTWKQIIFPVFIFLILLSTVPYGLLLHHPWNYLAFFSPLYWSSWAWVIPAPAESLVYGIISVSITLGCIVLFLTGVPRHMRKE